VTTVHAVSATNAPMAATLRAASSGLEFTGGGEGATSLVPIIVATKPPPSLRVSSFSKSAGCSLDMALRGGFILQWALPPQRTTLPIGRLLPNAKVLVGCASHKREKATLGIFMKIYLKMVIFSTQVCAAEAEPYTSDQASLDTTRVDSFQASATLTIG
jgi:hypothetical protein